MISLSGIEIPLEYAHKFKWARVKIYDFYVQDHSKQDGLRFIMAFSPHWARSQKIVYYNKLRNEISFKGLNFGDIKGHAVLICNTVEQWRDLLEFSKQMSVLNNNNFDDESYQFFEYVFYIV